VTYPPGLAEALYRKSRVLTITLADTSELAEGSKSGPPERGVQPFRLYKAII
jgi:hypothetical protein